MKSRVSDHQGKFVSSSRRRTAFILSILCILVGITYLHARAEGNPLNLVFNCVPNNDLYRVLAESGAKCPRYDTPDKAVEHAKPGSAVLILADRYPDQLTKVELSVFDKAAEKRLRLYVEYPAAIPGLRIGAARGVRWERAVVSSDAFGDALPLLRILSVNSCRFVPVPAKDPLMVIAHVAGYDTAVYGLPETTYPLLFEANGVLIATTKLSGFVSERYAPSADWGTVWEGILKKLDPGCAVRLKWTPVVRPAYGPDDKLPADAETRALRATSDWVFRSRLLIHPSREAEVHNLLRADTETIETPDSGAPVGDGSRGILEGYASAIQPGGVQLQRVPIRADCCAETAMSLALDWMVNGNTRSRDVAKNLLDFVYFNSGMCKGDRGDPKHPAYGLIAWGDVSPSWLVANYGDDDARVLLATMLTSAALDTDRWNEQLMRGLMANLRTTGKLGFRGDRIDMPQITALGWKHYHDAETVNIAPHFESYLWACYLWAYGQTHYKPFLERTKTAIRVTMEAYPSGWRWQDSVERARMMLCLAWLVRVEDTPEHRRWLDRVTDDLISLQQPSGAIRDKINEQGGGGHLWSPRSNEAYGTTETPLIQRNGDPATDQLYTSPFAFLALHEAYAATGDPKFKTAEDKLASFLVRIQTRSDKLDYLNGTWFRAFDYERWDYWASSGDMGWGAWSVEAGWGTSWAAVVLGLRAKGTSFWDATSGSKIIEQFPKVHSQMAD